MVEWDLLNWHAMIIELAIAGVLAVGLSLYFHNKQTQLQKNSEKVIKETNKTLQEATKIIKEGAEFRKRRESWYQSEVRRRIQRIISDVDDIETGNVRYKFESTEKRTERIEIDCKFMNGDAKKIREIIKDQADVFDPSLVKNIEDYLLAVDDYQEVALESDETRKAFATNIKHYTKMFFENLPNDNDE